MPVGMILMYAMQNAKRSLSDPVPEEPDVQQPPLSAGGSHAHPPS